MSPDYQVHISDTTHDPAWDAYVTRMPGGYYEQTSGWAKVKAHNGWKLHGPLTRFAPIFTWRPVRITIWHQGTLVAGVQLLVRAFHLPMLGHVAHIPRGPIFTYQDAALVQILVQAIRDVIRQQRIIYLFFEVPDGNDELVSLLSQYGFRPAVIKSAVRATLLIDITPEPEQILANMKINTRNAIRRSTRNGITVREGTDADLPCFYQNYLAATQRRSFRPVAWQFFSDLWHFLHPAGIIHMLVAEYEGTSVTHLLFSACGDRVSALYIGWNGMHRHLLPNEAVYWKLIHWGKAHGYAYFDFYGIDIRVAHQVRTGTPSLTEKRFAWNYFKLRFGGDVIVFPRSCVYTANPLLSRLIRSPAFWKVVRMFPLRGRSRI